MRFRPTILTAALFFVFVLPSFAQSRTFVADLNQSKVEFTLGATLHTVHGAFRLKSGNLHFDQSTGAADGQLIVDAQSGNTGNQARDRKMKKDILETEKYPEIIFTPQKVSGAIAPQGKSQIQLEGGMLLHGQPHPMQISVPLTVVGDTVSADIPFEVPYVKWGLKNPSTLFLKVSDKVEINIHMVGKFAP